MLPPVQEVGSRQGGRCRQARLASYSGSLLHSFRSSPRKRGPSARSARKKNWCPLSQGRTERGCRLNWQQHTGRAEHLMPSASNTSLVSHFDCPGGGQVWVHGTT